MQKKKKSFLQGYDKKETFTTRHSIDTNYQSARKLTKMTQLVKDKLGIFSEEKKMLRILSTNHWIDQHYVFLIHKKMRNGKYVKVTFSKKNNNYTQVYLKKRDIKKIFP